MIISETVDMVIAIERIVGLAPPLRMLADQVASVREAAPELGPELDAIEARLGEALDHVLAAQAVLSARIDLLKDEA